MLHRINQQKGFTLIELLIVIAIIGILATIVTVSLGASQQRARDVQRKSDLKQIQNALEVYFNNTNAHYPSASSGRIVDVSALTWGTNWPNYIRVLPKDPLFTTEQYCYDVVGAPQPATPDRYQLYAKLENSNDADYKAPSTYPNCNGSTQYTYQLQNPF